MRRPRANKMLGTAMERLSTGKRINSAKDDAAGLAIATLDDLADPRHEPGDPQRQRRHLAGADRRRRAERSHQHAAAHPRTGRPGASRAPIRTTDRTNLQAEVTELAAQIDDIVTNTKFNGVALFDGSARRRRSTIQTGSSCGRHGRR